MKRPQEQQQEDLTLEVPDEIPWHIFQYAGTLWSASCGSHVCGAWARVVRTHCLCIDERSVALRAGDLRRVPNLRTLKKWFCIGSRSNGFSSLTALTTLHIEEYGLADSKHVLTMLRSLVNLTAVGQLYIVPSLLTSLRSLDFSRNTVVTDEIITALTGLQELRIYSCPDINTKCVSTLTMLRSLACSGMTDATLSHITSLTSLKLSFPNTVSTQSLSRLTQLNDLTLVATCGRSTTDDLLGLHLLTRLNMDDPTINFDYSPFTRLKCLEYYCHFPDSSLNERNYYHLLTNLVTLKCNDHLYLTPEWIKKMHCLRELSVGILTLSPYGVRKDLAQFTLLEGSVTRGSPKVCLLKSAFATMKPCDALCSFSYSRC